ncbi:hypothetical protein, partial [Nostoc sp. MG11]|uniref:hypothetical protein n=1 Tax=Nostoc sp. MG11 TaxID=2721166 RepID=UPI001D027544
GSCVNYLLLKSLRAFQELTLNTPTLTLLLSVPMTCTFNSDRSDDGAANLITITPLCPRHSDKS